MQILVLKFWSFFLGFLRLAATNYAFLNGSLSLAPRRYASLCDILVLPNRTFAFSLNLQILRSRLQLWRGVSRITTRSVMIRGLVPGTARVPCRCNSELDPQRLSSSVIPAKLPSPSDLHQVMLRRRCQPHEFHTVSDTYIVFFNVVVPNVYKIQMLQCFDSNHCQQICLCTTCGALTFGFEQSFCFFTSAPITLN